MLRRNANNKFFCTTHNLELQICQNSSTGAKFLKCPAISGFECGTINEGNFDPNDYEYYTPNYDARMTDYVQKLMDEKD